VHAVCCFVFKSNVDSFFTLLLCVGKLPCRGEKKVRFDGCVDLNKNWKYAKNEENKRTYADIVKMNKMKDTEN